MNQFLYRIQPTRLEMVTQGPTTKEAAIVSQHFDYLTSLTRQSIVLVFGRTQNRDANTFGICIFRADSEADARSIVDNDPAVRNGVMRAELYPYEVAGLNPAGWLSD